MIKSKKVLCNVLRCTEYKRRGVQSSTSMNEDVIFDSFDGCICYYGKPIEKNVPFIEISEPFYLYVPENKFNFIANFLIGFHSKFHRGITFDNKRFYNSSPYKLGDVYVEVSEE